MRCGLTRKSNMPGAIHGTAGGCLQRLTNVARMQRSGFRGGLAGKERKALNAKA